MAESTQKPTSSQNTAGALTYLLGPVTGIYFLMTEKNNAFIRFHAMQSTIVFVILFVATMVLFFLSSLISLVSFGLWLFLMYQAYQGNKYMLPVIGELAENLLKKKA